MIVFFFFKLAGMPDYLDRLEADLMALRLATEEAHENSCLRRKMTLKKLYLYWRNFISHWPKISANQKREFRGVVQMKIYEKAERGLSRATKVYSNTVNPHGATLNSATCDLVRKFF